MELFFTAQIAMKIGKTIGSYLTGIGSDYALEQLSFRTKVRKIIQKDKKYIRNSFSDSKYRGYPIEKFFFEKIFQDQYFLYPGSEFPKDKSDKLYKTFQEYIIAQDKDYSPLYDYAGFKLMLQDCVNNHNILVHHIILDPSQRLLEKDMKDYMSATGYAGHTLDPMTETLADNPDLEYTHRQIDSILHALRMDLRFYRFVLAICTMGYGDCPSYCCSVCKL